MPYLILSWYTRSSTELMGVLSFSKVRNAAKLAVYEDMVIRVKNHQALAKIRPERDLKRYQQNNRPEKEAHSSAKIKRIIW